MVTIERKIRWEKRVPLIFAWFWIAAIVTITLTATYVSDWFANSGTEDSKMFSIIACLVNMLFVAAMYVLDIGLLKTNGLLSYWRKKWDIIKDEPPYTTISICAAFFAAVLIIVVGADKTSYLSEFDLSVSKLVFATAFFSILIILVQLNLFDVIKVLPLDPFNRRRGRKGAWFLYIYMLYAFAFSVILIASLYSTVLGLITNLLGALLLVTYYYSRTPVYCEFTTDQKFLSVYDQLRFKYWPKNDPSRQAVVFIFKAEVVGGVQIHFSRNSEQRLPLERDTWNIRKTLEYLFMEGKTLAQVSQLIIEKDFQGRGTRNQMVRELWRIAKANNVDYAFVVAPEKPAKLYKKLGFEKLSVDYPFDSEHDGANLDLFILRMSRSQETIEHAEERELSR